MVRGLLLRRTAFMVGVLGAIAAIFTPWEILTIDIGFGPDRIRWEGFQDWEGWTIGGLLVVALILEGGIRQSSTPKTQTGLVLAALLLKTFYNVVPFSTVLWGGWLEWGCLLFLLLVLASRSRFKSRVKAGLVPEPTRSKPG